VNLPWKRNIAKHCTSVQKLMNIKWNRGHTSWLMPKFKQWRCNKNVLRTSLSGIDRTCDIAAIDILKWSFLIHVCDGWKCYSPSDRRKTVWCPFFYFFFTCDVRCFGF
jgi:hypothetical protein